nr:unnamed protein product [Callosobruchus analis]
MVRTYSRRPGSRNYKNYTEEALNRALSSVADDGLSLRRASEEHGIPFGTYYITNITPGAQTVFSEKEEECILKSVAKCAEWGFALTIMDLRMFAKALLDKQGRRCQKFKNNLPGIDWAYSLLKRHKHKYSKRIETNIKRARPVLSPCVVDDYFNNLEVILKDIPPSNIFNYDESNISDDPGKKLAIYRRGVKYPEKIMNFSKSSTTVMVCGSADDVLLPPYIIYKSLHLYDTWKEKARCGPPCCDRPCCSQGSRFNRTRLSGRKVLIGDNLSAHLDDEVIKLCREHDIDFVCLIPNSTHLCQPLDVRFFCPMKSAWREILTSWKMLNQRLTTLPKDTFPYLLSKALRKMDGVSPKPCSQYKDVLSGIKRNLMSGFYATGIYPVNKEKVLSRLPSENKNCNVEEIESTLTAFLTEQRYGSNPTEHTRRNNRLDVAPGKSISTNAGTSNERALDQDENSEPEDHTQSVVDEANEYIIGRYILANFYTARGKKAYRYVCQIALTEPLVVKGFKSFTDKRNFQIVEKDISQIDRSDVVAFLPNPLERSDCVEFPYDIDNQCTSTFEHHHIEMVRLFQIYFHLPS